MKLKDKNVLILGLAISGVSTAKALNKLGSKITVTDMKSEEELKEHLVELKDIDIDYVLGSNNVDLGNIDLIVKSPGIPLEAPIMKEALEKGIEVVTDIELAYRISKNKFIAITGTNGKTTTTALTGELIKKAGLKCHVTGNIGVGILWEAVNTDENDIFVIEASSFQLESTKHFKPSISVITNITPDHLNWHKTFDNYINAKKKVLMNQEKGDYTILNYDDLLLREIGKKINSNLIYFSAGNKLDRGVYVDDCKIIINDGLKSINVMDYRDIRIPGKHNIENALAVVAIGWAMGIEAEIIASTLKEFEGVEHRIEFVGSISGVSFYNDSKGTNPDASIKAIEAINKPIILIAGGIDKGGSFEEFIDSFDNKVKALILLGETREKIKDTAISKGFNNIYIVNSIKEAVKKSFELSESNDNVLLSPACASWDMFKSYEERGRMFKQAVKNLRED
ncbi:UDP-N-acetylmuramoyl-L-alanine--D-glutamate ligase [Proteiniborus sp. MB09-C3]|uniref:UDP-N-acetylmuramoyl-L-alanine--D-glutamate ligase n=1 Tax=Proteiniborus sp. MB09-C3 TaxID=3050072 RepID=UPI0025532AFA|nr:UDP-N-acetylmuramoyl-L-alanine--D-glutamate ligase [Proteiniborus sp. MB09-C3]WIV11243.1 UDP-N-acetylmuramoyl-L-alanine--D-glutamate ligase [Proteiniborus sp. MB09-C3]